jgi:hypothetical protein
MSSFFKSKNNNNKYYIYILINKNKYNFNNLNNINEIESINDDNNIIIHIIITKFIILQELSYIVNNIELIKNDTENKILNYFTYTYHFNDMKFVYPYEMFINNRILLHSFYHICKHVDVIQNILFKEKVYFISNMNYLKRIKDWSINWKKNKYSIEKYQQENLYNNNDHIFSIHNLSKYYFNINNIDTESNNKNYENEYNKLFYCKSMTLDEKSIFERISERPNTDLIENCMIYFEEDKQIRFL